jgi:GntR family transcriptional regulator
MAVARVRTNGTKSRRVAQELKIRLRQGAWAPGARLPSETEIARLFGVSRVTVRTGLKELETAGLIEIRHGAGTFVSPISPIGDEVRTSLQDLRSLTDTIRELGHTPSMSFYSRAFESLPAEPARQLLREPGSGALHLQRVVRSDETIVAVSFDWIPVDILPRDVTSEMVTGSTFAFLEGIGIVPVQSIAEIHAADASEIQWGPEWPVAGLCVLLGQTHFAARGQPVMFSRTYFVEGRFQFFIRRIR